VVDNTGDGFGQISPLAHHSLFGFIDTARRRNAFPVLRYTWHFDRNIAQSIVMVRVVFVI
jgi:hypothetical protein